MTLLEVMCAIAPQLVDRRAREVSASKHWGEWCDTYAKLVREMAEAFIAEGGKGTPSLDGLPSEEIMSEVIASAEREKVLLQKLAILRRNNAELQSKVDGLQHFIDHQDSHK